MQMIMVVEEKDKEKEFTTIRITKKTRAELDGLGDIHEENYEDILQRMIRNHKIFLNLRRKLDRMRDLDSDRKETYDEIIQRLSQGYQSNKSQ